jgi:acetyl coenzyme A synthetase (ADP forming)-like protein
VDIEILNAIIRPKSVAVVGASSHPGKIGYTVLDNIIKSGFTGEVYPINPSSQEILNLKCYPSILDVGKPIDSAIITVPAQFTLSVIEECGKAGVKGLSIITSGFGEVGNHELEENLVKMAHQYHMRIIGPNIVGILSNTDKFNGSFAPFLPLPGKASLVSQSGALLIAIDAATFSRRIGFDKLISVGNMSDLNFSDLITWLDEDPNTSCITLYIEGFKDGRDVIKAGSKSKKPIVAIKAGISSHGAAAAASHTGSLAGATKVYKAALQQGGFIQATDLNDLFDRTLVLSLQPPMKGDNLLIITNGGGVGVLATDAAEKYGVPLKFAPQDVQDELKKYMPDFGSAKNPVDLTGMAGNDWYYSTVKYAFAHQWVNGLVVLYCETAMTNPSEIAQSIKKAINDSGIQNKPVTVSFVGGERSEAAMRWLVESGIPAYGAPDLAVNAMSALHEYSLIKESNAEIPQTTFKGDRKSALEIIKKAREDHRDALTEIEAKQVFSVYGLPVTLSKLAKTEEQAVIFAKEIGYPVVMKVVSPDILHKSDAGAVKVNIKNEGEARNAYKTILANCKAYKADANIHGIVVQEFAPIGTEVIIGSVNDPTFGPTVMFGLGGIFVEVLKDVTFRVSPVTKNQAAQMIEEIRGAPILAGVRGEEPRDKVALVETICRYSQMIEDLSSEVSESDANPVLVYGQGKGVKVVDARIILKKN